ncbi:helix-turn-helix domain-containing protein [Streptomyces sp. NBC_00984]|uniref:helix-turn-helix domain-containing protein n=1 Tax=Streptomyces sp. NBC_00984 TaxID=2903700 RepID=UPI00386E07DB|nr:helix-turn-helix domain-containing protein [Streptomyces sp. NBC_00984]
MVPAGICVPSGAVSDRVGTAAGPNTVDYRLGRIARLCGIDAADPAERLTASAALYARDRAGYHLDTT